MQRRHALRLIYVAVGLLLLWLAVIGGKTAGVLLSPVAVGLDAADHGSIVHFQTDRSAVVADSDCVNVTWHTENIQAVFLGENSQIGEGTEVLCGDSPGLTIEFRDGAELTYDLPRDVVFDITNSLITLALITFAAYLVCAYVFVRPDDTGDQQAIKRREIRPLTSYRALAALMVFFYHVPVPADGVLFALQATGSVGVTFFFVLSGFLIASRYMDEIADQAFRWRTYLVRRVARILPIYYAIVIISALWGQPFDLTHLTLTQAYFPNVDVPGISTAWTLTIEESFYLLLPLILWLCWRSKRPWWVLITVVAVAYLIGFVLVSLGTWEMGYMLTRTIFGRMLTFMIGVGCALVYRRWQPGKRAWLLSVLCIVGFLVWSNVVSTLSGDDTIIRADWVAALLAGGLIISLTSQSGWIVRILSWSPFVYAGRISYALYLIQLTPPVEQIRTALKPVFGDASSIVLYILVSLICVVLYELIEKPAHRWILRRFNATGSPKAASVQSS